jgi:hypothetical protein
MTVKEIIIDYIKQHGFDGLCDLECGCGLDDFAPCGDVRDTCEPAYKRTREECAKCEQDCYLKEEDYNAFYCTKERKPDESNT